MRSDTIYPGLDDLEERLKSALDDARAALHAQAARETSETKTTLELLKRPDLTKMSDLKERFSDVKAAANRSLKDIESRKSAEAAALADLESAAADVLSALSQKRTDGRDILSPKRNSRSAE